MASGIRKPFDRSTKGEQGQGTSERCIYVLRARKRERDRERYIYIRKGWARGKTQRRTYTYIYTERTNGPERRESPVRKKKKKAHPLLDKDERMRSAPFRYGWVASVERTHNERICLLFSVLVRKGVWRKTRVRHVRAE